MTATISSCLLTLLVVGFHPASLSDMHGGIPKELCLIAYAWVAWELGLLPVKL
jgi:hypothetical protein